ncbi:MAG: META domain-containing protein [Spirulina sp.]
MKAFRTTAFLTASVAWMGASCMVPISLDEQDALVGTVWELQQIQMNDGTQFVADPPQNYTVEFSEAGEVFIQADCNRAAGAFTLEDGMLSITLGPTTTAACPDGSIDTQFLSSLSNANLVFFQGDDMFIDLAFDSGTMQFSPAETMTLTGRVWELQDIQFNDGKLLVAEPPENYTVEFMDDGSMAVRADCNRGRGSFTTETDGRITIDPIATTLAACPEGSLGNDFTQALSSAAIYFFQDDQLFIDLKFGSGTMRLSEAATPSLMGTVWKLQQIQYNDDTLIVPSTPDNYTIEFMDGGSVVVQADCNQGRGSFTTTDNRLSIGELATTRMACPPGSSDAEFLRALDNASSFFFQDGQLIVELMYDSGSMVFSAR